MRIAHSCYTRVLCAPFSHSMQLWSLCDRDMLLINFRFVLIHFFCAHTPLTGWQVCWCFQIVVFGRELERGEFQQLSESVRQQKTHEVMDIIRKRIMGRRQQQLDTSIVWNCIRCFCFCFTRFHRDIVFEMWGRFMTWTLNEKSLLFVSFISNIWSLDNHRDLAWISLRLRSANRLYCWWLIYLILNCSSLLKFQFTHGTHAFWVLMLVGCWILFYTFVTFFADFRKQVFEHFDFPEHLLTM